MVRLRPSSGVGPSLIRRRGDPRILGPTTRTRLLSTDHSSPVAYLTAATLKSKDNGLSFLALDRPQVSWQPP